MVQRAVFTVAIACVPCGPRRSLIYAWAWGFCVCWKLSAAEKVKPDSCRTPAVVSTLLTPLPVSCPLTTPLHYTCIKCIFPAYPQRSHSTFGMNAAYSLTSHSILVVDALYPQRPHSIFVVTELYPQRPHSILVVNAKTTFRSYGDCTLSTKIIFHFCSWCTLLTNFTFYLCGECKYHIPSLRWMHFTHKHLFASLWWMPLIRWRRRTTHLLPSGNLFSPNSISCRITACTAASTPQGPPCEWNHRLGVKNQLSVYNNNGYLECLTCTGPKCLHIL